MLTLRVIGPRCTVVALGVLLPSACSMTHTYHLSGFDAAPTPVPGLDGKRVAVVFVEPGMRKEYKSKADGHTFIFRDTERYYAEGMRGLYGRQLAALDFYNAPTTNRYDLYVFPSLELKVSSSLLTKTCTAKYTVIALDAQSQERFRATREGSHAFQLVDNADEACKIAILEAFPEPTAGAIATLATAAPQPALAAAPSAPPPPPPEAVPPAPPPSSVPASPPPPPPPPASVAPASPAAPPTGKDACFPPCRKSYVCVRGQCVSACNPPCPAGETCTAEGECVR
jgi:hypothetical protein